MDIKSFLASKTGTTVSQATWARRCGVTRGYFSQLVLYKKKPSLDLAYVIETVTQGKVKMQDWFKKSETEA